MKTLAALSLALAVIAMPVLSHAQEERSASGAISDKSHDPNAPKGAQGHPIDQTTGKEVEVNDQDQAKNQAPLATGQDLKGPAVQLPPSKTAE